MKQELKAKIFYSYAGGAKVQLWLPNPVWQKEANPQYDITGIDTSKSPFKLNLKSSVGISMWYDYKPAENHFVLLVKSLSKMSRKDALEIAKLRGNVNVSSVEVNNDGFYISYVNDIVRRRFVFWVDLYLPEIDYLRSKGYALHYEKYSINTLIEKGIFKLI